MRVIFKDSGFGYESRKDFSQMRQVASFVEDIVENQCKSYSKFLSSLFKTLTEKNDEGSISCQKAIEGIIRNN